MTTSTLTPTATTSAESSATRSRLAILALLLAVSSLAVVPAGLLWPEPSGGGETYAYGDIAGRRHLWWGLLTFTAVIAIIGTTLQALATTLVRRRGSAWVTVGSVLAGIGIVGQGVGGAGWATAYFYPTDPGLDAAVGRASFDVVNAHIVYIFAVMTIGAALAIIGQILQVVGLLRAKVVPVWVPIGLLFTVLTFVVPGNGALGLITAIPMSAAAIALGWYAYRRAQ